MISTTEIIIRLLLGAAIGGIIGFERSTHGRAAGFRTHLLVCVAGVLIMTVSEYYHYLSMWDPSYIRIDPARLAAGAITGVGFLGAGVIVKSGLNVQGLTTAACLWIVSAIGLSIGSGLYVAGLASFVITYLSLWLLRMVEDKMPRLSYKFMTIVVEGPGDEESIRTTIRKCGASMEGANYERDLERSVSTYSVTLSYKDEGCPKRILDGIASLPAVKKVVITSR
jgi:putative Mg2+ transporter-C (MgtC) family protein